VTCLNDDLASLFAYLRCPVEHHKRLRHSTFIERTFGETRRRVKVIGRLPAERFCLDLVGDALDRASRGWPGVSTIPATVRQLRQLRLQLLHSEPDKDVTTVVAETTAAAGLPRPD
jgi:putative transposase